VTHQHAHPASAGAAPPDLHVRGVVLPDGEERDLYVRGGHVTYEPVPGAETVATGWILPGLVDAHCHVGLDAHGAVDEETQEAQALADRDSGALLLRDAGSAADTRWMDDREDLPRLIRAGRHIARTRRYIPNYAEEIEPEDLVAEVTRQARRGDGWVKLVGDWIDRGAGDLAPCWPREVLAAAMDAAHAAGARVTAHVFSSESLPDLIEAGIDCLEHGTGLTDDLIDLAVQRQLALVPTLIQVASFPAYADQGEARFPAYAAHMRRLHAAIPERMRHAHEAGIPMYAGTDAGGALAHGLVAQEVLALQGIGMTAEEALGAASWRARAWLGHAPTLDEGVPADFVVLDSDPRADLTVLAHPRRIVLRGRVVA
jgi:imidazolonepropionase-like amidohydrolase